jgi:hypothetical protein
MISGGCVACGGWVGPGVGVAAGAQALRTITANITVTTNLKGVLILTYLLFEIEWMKLN